MLIDMRSRDPGWASSPPVAGSGHGEERRGTEYMGDCGVQSVALESSVPVATQSTGTCIDLTFFSNAYLNFHWVARTARMAGPQNYGA
jgi:hypothetical protein